MQSSKRGGARRRGGGRSRKKRGGRQPAPPDTQDNGAQEQHQTPLQLALKFAREDNVEALTPLIASEGIEAFEREPEPEPASLTLGEEQCNVLVAAAGSNAGRAVKLLLAHGASLSGLGSTGARPLMAAAAHGHVQLAALLLDRGAALNGCGAADTTALHAASHYSKLEMLRFLLAQPDIDVGRCDAANRSALHLAASAGFAEGIKMLLAAGAKVTHDSEGLCPLSYAFRSFTGTRQGKTKKKRGSQKKPISENDLLLEAMLELSDHLPFFFSAFRIISHKSARDALVKRHTLEKVFGQLTQRQLALDENVTYNEILVCICRILKASNQALNFPIDQIRAVFSIVSTEGSLHSIQSLTSLLCQPSVRTWITPDILAAIFESLLRGSRICLFGQQPHVDYAIDFVFLLFPVYLRLLIELAGSLSEQDRTARYADMQVIWDNLHQVLLDVDFNIQDSERFALLLHCMFLWEQVFPLDAAALAQAALSSQPKGRQKRTPALPTLHYFIYRRPVSERFKAFVKLHRSAIDCLAEDIEDLFAKYFEFECRLGGHVGKAKFIHSVTARSQSEVHLSLNRFDAHNSEDSFEFLVQQALSANPMGFNANLVVEFMDEPGVGEGPLREMLEGVRSYLFSPTSRYFAAAPSNLAFHIRADGPVDEQSLRVYEVAGRMVGLSLTTGFPLGARLTSALLLNILQPKKELSPEEMEDFDVELSHSMSKLLKTPIADLGVELTFECSDVVNGSVVDVPLCNRGADMVVTDDNKQLYVSLLLSHRAWSGIEAQVDAFGCGFMSVVPQRLSSMLSTEELRHLLQGPERIDIDWMRSELVTYSYGFTANSPVVNWFWRYVEELAPELQARLLQFWSGSPVPPLKGFAPPSSWAISPQLTPVSSLPRTSTCSFNLQIPRYESFEQLSERFDVVLESGFVGYDMA